MIIALDTETYKFNEKEGVYEPILDAREFALGCIKTDTGITEFFTDREEMWNWLIKLIEKNKLNKKRTFIYGHNIEYDWYGIAKNHLLDDKVNYICQNPFIAIYDEKGYFLDTMAFYRMSLKEVGKIIGLEKGEMPFKIKDINELKQYLERDVDITLQCILRLKKQVNELGFNPRKLMTAGQLAITSFLTYCRRENIDWDFTEYNNDKKIRQIIKTKYPKEIREAFRGGMNQAFQIGKFDNVTLIDVNGLYAYIMVNMDFPDLRTELREENVKIGMLEKYIETNIGIARCKIKSPKTGLPYLPIRFQKYTIYENNKIMRGTWTYLELRKAKKLGYEILECEWSIRWNKAKINPLKNFINHLYGMEKR